MEVVRGDLVVEIVTADAVLVVELADEPASLHEHRELVGSRVARLVATDDGSLRLRTDRREVVVPPGDAEAWQIRSGGDVLGVSAAGGGLAIF